MLIEPPRPPELGSLPLTQCCTWVYPCSSPHFGRGGLAPHSTSMAGLRADPTHVLRMSSALLGCLPPRLPVLPPRLVHCLGAGDTNSKEPWPEAANAISLGTYGVEPRLLGPRGRPYTGQRLYDVPRLRLSPCSKSSIYSPRCLLCRCGPPPVLSSPIPAVKCKN